MYNFGLIISNLLEHYKGNASHKNILHNNQNWLKRCKWWLQLRYFELRLLWFHLKGLLEARLRWCLKVNVRPQDVCLFIKFSLNESSQATKESQVHGKNWKNVFGKIMWIHSPQVGGCQICDALSTDKEADVLDEVGFGSESIHGALERWLCVLPQRQWFFL